MFIGEKHHLPKHPGLNRFSIKAGLEMDEILKY